MVCVAYLAVTVGESILAPVFPAAAEDLGLDLAATGIAIGLLIGSVAVANIAGGYLLARGGPKVGILTALGLTAVGGLVAAATTGVVPFFGAQVLLGLGSGTFFASGINAVGVLGGTRRRGLAMAVFGVAFSGGLTLAALVAALGTGIGWRVAFAIGGGFAALAAVLVSVTPLPTTQQGPAGGTPSRLRDALGVAAIVGSVGAVAQYGVVSFLPTFAVDRWEWSAGRAALLLAFARALSVPTKMVSGNWADRRGTPVTIGRLSVMLTASGLWWMIVPSPAVAAAGAVVFAATASAVFPVANLLAFEGFGDRGPLLGTFRSVQMGVGALASATIGGIATLIGLRLTLVFAVLVPLTLLAVSRSPAEVAASTDEVPA